MQTKRGKIIIALLLIALIFNGLGFNAYANSAAPIRPDDGSGIVFKEHEQIKIESEVLDIVINDDVTASITAKYIMKNVTDEAVSVQTMFVSPLENGVDKNIEITKNGEQLEFSQEFFGIYDYFGGESKAKNIENWQEILKANTTRTYPLGDGGGFYEYKIKYEGQACVEAAFKPESVYFTNSDRLERLSDDRVLLTNVYQADIIVVSAQNLTIESENTIEKTAIVDVYDYLYNYGLANSLGGFRQFANEQFNLFLASIDVNQTFHNFFELMQAENGVGAITYFVDFEPSEQVELVVSYVYQLGTGGYGQRATLLYYLSPIKYWLDTPSLEINLYLSEKFMNLTKSSIEFEKIQKRHYRYFANELPQQELKIEVGTNSIFGCFCGTIAFDFNAACVLLLCFAFAIIILGYKKGEVCLK